MATGAPVGVTPQLTPTSCIDCGKRFPLGAEVYLATIRYASGTGSDVQENDVVDSDGALLYGPLFFDQKCLDEVIEGLQEIVGDEPPFECEGALLSCEYCGSDILPLEVYCRIQFGELRASPRRPAGQLHHQFVRTGSRGWVMCISCMTHVSDQVLEIWTDVGQQGECGDCQHVRCWRDDSCELECGCHDEPEEEESEDEEEELYERGDRVAYTADFLRYVPAGFQPPASGVVQSDQEPDEEEVFVAWSDGTRSHTHVDHIELL